MSESMKEAPTWKEVMERIQMGDIAGARSLFNLGIAMNFGKNKPEEPSSSAKDAFEEFYQQPLIRLSVSQLQGDSDFKHALFWNAFVAGCKHTMNYIEGRK